MSLSAGQHDGQEYSTGQKEGIVETGDNAETGDAGQCGGDEQLCTVGDNPLGDAGEGIQQRSAVARFNAVFFADGFGDGTGHDDGYGIVGGGDVHEDGQQADAETAAASAFEVTANEVQQGLKAAAVPHNGTDGRRENGDNHGFKHAVCSRTHGGEGCG